jgi:hypothetical protein
VGLPPPARTSPLVHGLGMAWCGHQKGGGGNKGGW